MKKRILMALLAMTLAASMFSACGKDKAADAATEAATEGDTFSLLDITEEMVDVGAYGMSNDGVELVFTMFNGPDGNQYVSLFGFDNNQNSGDVICGQYEASTEKDDEGKEWTNFIVSDVYTGGQFHLGVCENPETDEVSFYDKDGNEIAAEFLSAADTIKYMGSAASLISGDDSSN